jgi:hypothetical protein
LQYRFSGQKSHQSPHYSHLTKSDFFGTRKNEVEAANKTAAAACRDAKP